MMLDNPDATMPFILLPFCKYKILPINSPVRLGKKRLTVTPVNTDVIDFDMLICSKGFTHIFHLTDSIIQFIINNDQEINSNSLWLSDNNKNCLNNIMKCPVEKCR